MIVVPLLIALSGLGVQDPVQLPFFRPSTMESARFTADDGSGEYFFQFRIHMEEEPEEEEVYRVIRTRPEAPAGKFSMSDLRIATVKDVTNRPRVDTVRSAASSINAENNSGRPFFQALERVFNRSRESVDFRAVTIDPNEGIRSGGWTVRTYGWDVWFTDTHVQLMKVGTGGRAEPVGQETVFELYEYWIMAPLLDEKFIPDPVYGMDQFHFADGFGGIKFNDQQADMLGLGGVYLPRIRTSVSIFGDKGTTTSATTYRNEVLNTLPKRLNDFSKIVGLAPKKVDDMLNAVAGQGSSMNSLNVPGDLGSLEAPSCGSELVFPPSTLWVPDRPGYQTMMTTTPMRVTFPAFASLKLPASIVANGRTHCLNKALKEPTGGVRYFPYMSNDPVLEGLAKLTEASRMRGPWDQVRTWIYTDHVGLEEANKRIAPPITESQYLNGLFDVFKLGGLSDKIKTDKKVFSPGLLVGAYSSDSSFSWFLEQLAQSDSKTVRTWLESRPAELVSLITSPANEYETEHAVRLFSSLLSSPASDLRLGALAFLDRTGGIEKALRGKIGSFEFSVNSENESEAMLARNLLARFSPS